MTDATKRRFAMPREIRIILSAGCLVFVFEYLVLPQFASARQNLHLLALLNPFLVGLAVLLEIAAIYAYVQSRGSGHWPRRTRRCRPVGGPRLPDL